MKYSVIISAAAGLSLAVSAPAFAQQSNGEQTREQARKNSQGPANANKRGDERSNENSVLKGSVKPGMMVHDKNGKMLGKVREVRRSPDGTIIAIIVVLVVQINGSNIIQLSPASLTIINNVLVTTQITVPSGS